MKRIALAAAVVIGSIVLAAAAVVTGLRIAGPTEAVTDLGRVSMEVDADTRGAVDAFVPIADWGIRADAFDAPFELKLQVESLNRKGALDAAGGDQTALDDARDELKSSARSTVLKGFAWSLGLVFLVAAVLWLLRTRFRRLGAVAIGVAAAGLVGIAGSLVSARATFDSDAFSTPAYYGRGQELSQLLAFFERQQDNDRYSSTFDNALSNFSAYLADAPRVGETPGTQIYFGSDIHNNVPIVDALEGFVGEEPFVLAGDFALDGSEADAKLISPRLARLSDEVIAVSGNHDSAALMERLEADGITVLGEGTTAIDVNGLRMAGFADPLESETGDPASSGRVFSFPELDDGGEAEEEAKADLVAWFESQPVKPDIVLVHQSGLAAHLANELAATGYEEPLTIITGHNHYQHYDRYGGGNINVVNAGTLGAGGPLRVGQESAGLGRLYFQGDTPILEAIDFIRIEPLSGQAQAERVLPDIVCPSEETIEEVCRYEPG